MSRNGLIALLLLVLVSVVVAASDDDAADSDSSGPCAAPEFRQFDFWVGEWELTWGDSGRGENVIVIELDSCVIVENFTTAGEQPFRGRSVSTFNKHSGKWHQTWVDNAGGYLDFVGGPVADSMILSRTAHRAGSVYRQRMVWYNISEDSLDWNWERSLDDGVSWDTLWEIHYLRRR